MRPWLLKPRFLFDLVATLSTLPTLSTATGCTWEYMRLGPGGGGGPRNTKAIAK